MEKDIAYGVARPRTENRRETADLSDEEVRRVFSAMDERSYVYASHRAILAVGFFTGLRSAEIRGLKMEHLGNDQGIKILRLKIKGDKSHEIPLHPFVIKALEEHIGTLKRRGFAIEERGHALFPSLKTLENRPMTPEALNYIFHKALDRAGIERSSFRRYCPHSGRQGSRMCRRALGHANPATTQRYNKRRKGP